MLAFALSPDTSIVGSAAMVVICSKASPLPAQKGRVMYSLRRAITTSLFGAEREKARAASA